VSLYRFSDDNQLSNRALSQDGQTAATVFSKTSVWAARLAMAAVLSTPFTPPTFALAAGFQGEGNLAAIESNCQRTKVRPRSRCAPALSLDSRSFPILQANTLECNNGLCFSHAIAATF